MSTKQTRISLPVLVVAAFGLTALALASKPKLVVSSQRLLAERVNASRNKNAATDPTIDFSTSTREKPVRVLTVTPARSAPNQIQAEVIMLRRRGFEPSQITRPHGQFFLVVLNRSGVWEVNYQLNRLAGDKLYEIRVPREKRNWQQVVNLGPGDYVLKEVNHPSWICKFTITPK